MAVGEIVGGVVLDLLTAGLQRSGSIVFQKMSRLRKVESTIKGLPSKNQNVQVAIRDFESAIGYSGGAFTKALSDFLGELSKTGLIEVIAENALLGRESDQARSAFRLLHGRFFVDPKMDHVDPDVLYQKISGSFSVTLKELSKDSVIHGAIQASHREISHRLDAVDEAMRSLKSYTVEPRSYESLLPTLIRIARGLQQSYKNIRIETNRGPRQVEINKIYIPPKLNLRDSQSNIKRSGPILRSVQKSLGAESGRVAYHSLSEGLTTFSYGEIINSFRRVVVLGDPGGGKSTLCQKLCFDMAKHTALVLQFSNEKRLGGERQKLPIRIILRKFEQAREKDPQLDLLSYIVRDIIHYAGGDIKDIAESLEYLLENGRALLAFDGLDEILDTSRRQDFVELVTALSDRFPLCPVLVTSRLVGYDDARLGDDFEEILLQKFDDSEVKDYVKKFMSVVGGKVKSECVELSQKFIDETSETASDLRRNALLLGLMSWLFLANGDVPSNRPEIYKECSILLFEKWDQKRGIIADSTNDFDRSQLFISLAAQIYGVPALAGGVSKTWLKRVLEQEFFSLYEDKSRAFKATSAFVAFITGRAWVMSEVGTDIFAFTHQTFLEYFFARHLDDVHDGVPSLLRFLKKRIVKSEWNEIAHLSLQLKTHRSLRKQEEAISFIIDAIKNSKMPKHQLAWMKFGSQALEYLSPSEATVGKLIDLLLEIAFERASGRDNSAITSVIGVTYSARERRDFVRGRLVQRLRDALEGPNLSRAEIAAALLAGRSFFAAHRGDNERSALPREVCNGAIEGLRSVIIGQREARPLFAALGWSWYREIDEAIVAKHGVAPFFSHPPLGALDGLNGFASLALDTTGEYRFNGKEHMEPSVARRGLKILAAEAMRQRPIDGGLLKQDSNTAEFPAHVWSEIYNVLRDDDEAVVAAIIAHHISLQSSRRSHRTIAREARVPRWKMGQIYKEELSRLRNLSSTATLAAEVLGCLEAGDILVMPPVE